MMRWKFDSHPSKPLEVLCLGAHSDDIEIGCGGTVLRLRNEFPVARFHWVVFSATGPREGEATKAAKSFAGSSLATLKINRFSDGFMPFEGRAIKDVFEKELKDIRPDIVFTHRSQDAHQDHRVISELTWNTFRDHMIMEYEIPKYDGDLGNPNVFVPLHKDACDQKVQSLIEIFESQSNKRWFAPETFTGLMRVRGMECNAPSGYAEGFFCRKVVL